MFAPSFVFLRHQFIWYALIMRFISFFTKLYKDTTFMHISLDIPPIIYILLSISSVFSLIYIIWEFINYHSLKKSIEKSSKSNSLNKHSECDESCGVSVIVYSNNNPNNLVKNLPTILNQDYPLYEVIVVNDGKNEDISDYIERLSLQHPNLHYSYTPDDAHNLSRKKLSLMIGIKAAKYDIILTTNSYCMPQSDKWISSMARHFAQGKDVVIGHSVENFSTAMHSFLSLRNTIKYLVHALRHKPYRGTSNNLAYRKSIFFNNKGFSRSMHLHYGEDDLFVNEITTHNNTAIELTTESITIVNYENPTKAFNSQKLHQAFSERKIRSTAMILSPIRTSLYFSCLIILCGTIILGYNNLIIISASLLIALLFIILQIIIYRKTAYLLQSEILLFSIPLFTLIQPIVNTYYRLKCYHHRSYFYTWQPLRS